MPLVDPGLLSVCILGADDRSSIIETIRSVQRAGLFVHVGVHRLRDELTAMSGVHQHVVHWNNDFAAARNQLLERVPATYLLWIDSDETLFSFGQFDLASLQGDLFSIRIKYTSDSTPGLHIRFHRNTPDVRWSGAIHERLHYFGRYPETPPMPLPGIMLVHDGYEHPGIVREKDDRNAAIASRQVNLDRMTRGELTALARSTTAYNRFNIMLWLWLWQHPEQRPSIYIDQRFEPAWMLLSAGYSRPARELLRVNPLIVSLQVGMLADAWRHTGKIEPAELENLHQMLDHALFDPNYTFQTKLLRVDRDRLAAHIIEVAKEWMHRRADNQEDGMPELVRESLYIRTEQFESESLDDDMIIMHTGSWRALILNPVSAALWEALEWPHTPGQLADLLAEALPEEDRNSLDQQVTTVLGAFLANEFVTASEG